MISCFNRGDVVGRDDIMACGGSAEDARQWSLKDTQP